MVAAEENNQKEKMIAIAYMLKQDFKCLFEELGLLDSDEDVKIIENFLKTKPSLFQKTFYTKKAINLSIERVKTGDLPHFREFEYERRPKEFLKSLKLFNGQLASINFSNSFIDCFYKLTSFKMAFDSLKEMRDYWSENEQKALQHCVSFESTIK